MTGHAHSMFVAGCHRCDLHKDEVNGWIDSLVMVTGYAGRAMFHEPDCHHARRAGGRVLRPRLSDPLAGDVACSACLDGELPIRPSP